MFLSEIDLKELLAPLHPVKKGKNFTANCPVCGQREFGVSIYENDHPFGCFRKKACGVVGTIFKLARLIGKAHELSAGQYQQISTSYVNHLQEVYEPFDLSIETIHLPLGFKLAPTHPYFKQRGLKDVEYYQPGISLIEPKLSRGYVILPIFRDRQLKATVGRLTLGNLPFNKYENTKTDFTKLLYGYDDLTLNTSTIILVEGPFDKLRVDQELELLKQDEVKCLCTFGAKLSKEQLVLLCEWPTIKQVYLLFDGDVIPIIKQKSQVLSLYFKTKVCLCKEKDPGDMDFFELENVLGTARSPDEFLTQVLPIKKLRA